MDIMEKQYLFGSILLLSNKIQTVYDNVLGEITVMQFMLLNMLHRAEKGSLNLQELSKLLGSTRQNIRQIVDSLKKKSFVTCEKSESDKREVKVSLTQKALQYFNKNEELGNILLDKLFAKIDDKTLSSALSFLGQAFGNLSLITEEYRNEKKS